MATRADVASAAVAYRAAQLRLRAQFLRDSFDLWPVLDKTRIGESSPGWLRAQVALIRDYRARSATSAARYYADQARHRAPRVTLPPLDEDQVVRNLLFTGPGELNRAAARGLSPRGADEAARVAAAQSGARLSLAGGRDTISAAVRADPKALGWMRVTDADPCGFCAMLASRGPVYKSAATAGARDPRDWRGGDDPVSGYHDGCACQVVPVFTRSPTLPASSLQHQRLWISTTKGLHGAEARNAFRRAVEAR